MEGIGSRTGRPSSRYGSAPVFTGPVRRWQKQWVHVSSSVSYNHSSRSNSDSSNSNNNISAVRIRRWTPVSSVQSGGDSDSVEEERPRRKLRYAPIVVLESKKKEAEKPDVDVKEASKTSQSVAQGTLENDDNEENNSDNVLAAKAQKSVAATEDLNDQPMDLDVGDEDDDDEDHDFGGTTKAADWVKAAQKGFAR